MDFSFIQDLFEKIVKLVFDILKEFGVATENAPEWIQPAEDETAEA